MNFMATTVTTVATAGAAAAHTGATAAATMGTDRSGGAVAVVDGPGAANCVRSSSFCWPGSRCTGTG